MQRVAPSFSHSFSETPELSDLDVDLDLPNGARLEFSCKDGDIWVQANQAGWLHLARICAELGMRPEMAQGYHFHRTAAWGASRGPPEVSFEVIANGPA